MKTQHFISLILLAIAAALPLSCGTDSLAENQATSNSSFSIDKEFGQYWYQGKAEVTSYKLEQARYGEMRDGDAVLIFVTEDFSKSKQVKLDYPNKAPKDVSKILKLNFVKKFNTGIYPYSMMRSVFTPIDINNAPNSLKVTTSSQEWCGHVFFQMNLKGKQYEMQQNSYFESEGDYVKKIENALLEDEIWSRIRISPESLPTGSIRIVPSSFYTRLKHLDHKVMKANATLEASTENAALMSYTLEYPDLERTITINYQKDFPFQIESWEESYYDGWGAGKKKLTTKATKKESMLTDYWGKNSNSDASLRTDLGLSF